MSELHRKIVTLSFVHEEPRILLGMKKRGFGMGKWNGFGGKVEPGETLMEAAARELLEESGIRALQMEPAGFIHFDLEGRDFAMDVNLFRVLRHEGEPMETEEMLPKWFHYDEIPYESMWHSDRFWLPIVLKGNVVKGDFLLDNADQTVNHELKII